MKKYLLGLSAVILAIGASAFTKPTFYMASFHFIPETGNEIGYEYAANWESRATHPECKKTPNDVCILRIDYEKIVPYSGTTDVQKLAAFLADQNGTGDYINATDAVNACTFSKKP